MTEEICFVFFSVKQPGISVIATTVKSAVQRLLIGLIQMPTFKSLGLCISTGLHLHLDPINRKVADSVAGFRSRGCVLLYGESRLTVEPSGACVITVNGFTPPNRIWARSVSDGASFGRGQSENKAIPFLAGREYLRRAGGGVRLNSARRAAGFHYWIARARATRRVLCRR